MRIMRSWNTMHTTPYEQQRIRTLCLAGIVAVSLCAGVLIGRYSAAVFPVSSVASVPVEAKPQPVQQAKSPPAGSLAEHLSKSQGAVAAGSDKPESNRQTTTDGQTTSATPKPDASAQKQSAAVEDVRREERTVEPLEDNKIGGATILNPGANPRTRDAGKASMTVGSTDVPETQPTLSGDASPQNSECARRYASFRESDGTYQPYGSSQRRVCPLLR